MRLVHGDDAEERVGYAIPDLTCLAGSEQERRTNLGKGMQQHLGQLLHHVCSEQRYVGQAPVHLHTSLQLLHDPRLQMRPLHDDKQRAPARGSARPTMQAHDPRPMIQRSTYLNRASSSDCRHLQSRRNARVSKAGMRTRSLSRFSSMTSLIVRERAHNEKAACSRSATSPLANPSRAAREARRTGSDPTPADVTRPAKMGNRSQP